ncbi:DegT/DnrJ/EryC1/StrS family aminotransferase [Streptomyces sp. RerS4]|uniref:DegT/DnrJ/EryC1/StrS family aminotransferase n=1 Tax=Streptomyces sp. RerS4 TaxID=2942449 RepID=UPI00201C8BE9|nr:DegT/DnrJ/EryC1/StrS family aminotransferase [Streptomyces sp. RerS4]UQX05389.1 DegT/DnrJ/EryC1/StrS family aminotransferase [Streptomyces sp. RerS4]
MPAEARPGPPPKAPRPPVPFLDLRAPYAELRAGLDAAWARVMGSGRFVLGPEVEAFEAEFAAYCGGAHCVSVGDGGSALELILRGLGIGPGDEVIVPAHTFVATWLAVSATGARPVPAEVDEHTWTLDAAAVAAAVTPRTRAVIPVHLYGHPADLRALRACAGRYGLALVEDAAQAPGARVDGRRIGSGDSTVAFSLYPGKNLGAVGDGGAVVTSDGELARRIRLLRNYGCEVKYRHEVRGTNSRLDELQAAVLRVKLEVLDEWNARRADVAKRYLAAWDGLPGLTLPRVAPWAAPVWHLFVVRCARREELRRLLEAAGVETLIHYPVPVHRSGAYADAGLPAGAFPLSERLADEVLSLPIGPHLSAGQVERVVTALEEAFTRIG